MSIGFALLSYCIKVNQEVPLYPVCVSLWEAGSAVFKTMLELLPVRPIPDH